MALALQILATRSFLGVRQNVLQRSTIVTKHPKQPWTPRRVVVS